MLKIEKFVTMSPAQYEIVIEGMRNPMNSWDKIDSYKTVIEDEETLQTADFEYFIGENDLKLMTNLREAGTDHRKFMRMMPVWLTITAPLYWYKELDTYKVGTVANSCSTMHKIHAKEFTLEDFSVEECDMLTKDVYIQHIIPVLNINRGLFIETKDKKYWHQMIQLLPTSYNQKRTVFLNYEVLANIYRSRRNHKLSEWHVLCDWIEELPYAELIIGGRKDG